MNETLLKLTIRFEGDVVSVRQRARQVSGLLGFDAMDQARVATAVSEIARNALRYAGEGTVEFSYSDSGADSPALLIEISDRGPGIRNVGELLEGYTNGSRAAGAGMVSARRMVDTFHVESDPGRGTTVFLGKKLPRHTQAPSKTEVSKIIRELRSRGPRDPYEEIRQQNQELAQALDELRARQEELLRLNRELEDTNRGVVALYAELDEKAMHLRRADELKTRFLSNMSHEFRTPLNAIQALSRLLLEGVDGPLHEEQRKQVDFIQRSAQDLSDLVNDLLDIAKVEAGRITVTPAEMDVANLLGGLRGMFRPLLLNSAVALVIEEPQDVPRMYTDEGKVSQILRNFISNALKFTERGEVRVSARYLEDRQSVAFSVSDTGIGIAPEDQDRIFQEFTQLDSPLQRRVKGTGLGLPLAKRLAQLLGGSITLTSAVDAGSTFSAVIPVDYPGGRRISLAEARPEPDTSRYPVLIIEDNPETIQLYQRYLKGTAFQALPAMTSDEARRLLAEIRPVAILLDIMLPNGPSWDLLLDLKRDESTRGIPVYVVSVTEEALKARAFGADEFCLKPLERSWLLTRLRRLIQTASRTKLLVIDDDEVSRYLVRELLADTRYEVIEADSGRSGIAATRLQQPGVVLLDLVMPDMSGFDVLEQLGADPATSDIPVIIVTSKDLTSEEREQLSRAVAVLSKQVGSREEAFQTLRLAISRAEALRAKEVPNVQ